MKLFDGWAKHPLSRREKVIVVVSLVALVVLWAVLLLWLAPYFGRFQL